MKYIGAQDDSLGTFFRNLLSPACAALKRRAYPAAVQSGEPNSNGLGSAACFAKSLAGLHPCEDIVILMV